MIKKSYLSRYIIYLVFGFIFYGISAQGNNFNGKIQDSLQNPIPNTNMIATPLVEDVSITFAISSLDGEYRLKLQNNISYQIAITHLGFKKVTNTCNKPRKPLYLEMKQHSKKHDFKFLT